MIPCMMMMMGVCMQDVSTRCDATSMPQVLDTGHWPSALSSYC